MDVFAKRIKRINGRPIAGIVGFAGLVFLYASAAVAGDLTGTWEGKGKCKAFAKKGIVANRFPRTDPLLLEISHNGTDINAEMTTASSEGFFQNGVPALYDGYARATNAIQAGVARCTNDPDLLSVPRMEMGVFKVVRPTTMRYVSVATIVLGGQAVGLICKLTFFRTSSVDPNVPDCP